MQVHYACIAFFCARIAPVPLPPYSKNFSNMAKKMNRCFNSNKASETIKVGNVNDFPISKEAQQFINAIKNGIDKSYLYFLTEAFRGFSVPMQKAMVKFFVDVYSGRIDGETRLSFTGVTHVDNLLVSVLEKIDHDTKNLDYNE